MITQAILFILSRVARLTASKPVVFMGAAAIAARLLVSGLDPRPIDVMRLLFHKVVPLLGLARVRECRSHRRRAKQ
jgi:hypothetical protein